MNFLGQLFASILGLKRSFEEEYRKSDFDFSKKNLLGASFYNFGTSEVQIFGFTLRPYDANRGPDVYVLDTLPYTYDDDLIVPIKFGDTGSKNLYVTYSTLKKC